MCTGVFYFGHPLSVCYAKTIQINCHVRPLCTNDKQTNLTPTSINLLCTGLILSECCDLNRFLPMCLRGPSQIIVHEPSVTSCQFRGEAAALLPLTLYCSFSTSYLSQCGSVMATTTLQQPIKRGRSLSACRCNKTALD